MPRHVWGLCLAASLMALAGGSADAQAAMLAGKQWNCGFGGNPRSPAFHSEWTFDREGTLMMSGSVSIVQDGAMRTYGAAFVGTWALSGDILDFVVADGEVGKLTYSGPPSESPEDQASVDALLAKMRKGFSGQNKIVELTSTRLRMHPTSSGSEGLIMDCQR